MNFDMLITPTFLFRSTQFTEARIIDQAIAFSLCQTPFPLFMYSSRQLRRAPLRFLHMLSHGNDKFLGFPACVWQGHFGLHRLIGIFIFDPFRNCFCAHGKTSLLIPGILCRYRSWANSRISSVLPSKE